MKLKDKIKSYSFWVSLASAVILILKVLGSRFGFSVDESMVSDIFTAICSVLVLLGIIVIPQAPQTISEKQINQDTQEIASSNNLYSNSTETANDEPIKNLNQVTNDEVCKQDLTSVNFETQDTTKNLNAIIEIQDANETPNINLGTPTAAEISTIDLNTQASNNDNLQEPNNIAQASNDENLQEINNTEQADINQILNDEVNIDETSLSATLNEMEQVDNSENLEIENQTNLVNENLEKENLAKQTFEDLNTANLKSMLSVEREKFSGDIDKYIFELQEEIRKIRENL